MIFGGIDMTAVQPKHTLITEASIKGLMHTYDIGHVDECIFLTRGLNDTYRIKTANDYYIYRVYRHGWRDYSSIQFEADGLQHLKQRRFPVSYPIIKSDGTMISTIEAPEGTRYGVLFTYSPGERPTIQPNHAGKIGELLGKMHSLTDDFRSSNYRGFKLDESHLLDESLSRINPLIKAYLGEEAEEEIANAVKNIKKELSNKKLEVGFCHGDFHNHNMHINQGNLEVFDFDCSAIGYRAYDIAVAWWNIRSNYQSEEKACWNAFLSAYLEERNLSDDDFQSLPLFITARRIWLLGAMLENDDVWGSNWINKSSLELFILQIQSDRNREENRIR